MGVGCFPKQFGIFSQSREWERKFLPGVIMSQGFQNFKSMLLMNDPHTCMTAAILLPKQLIRENSYPTGRPCQSVPCGMAAERPQVRYRFAMGSAQAKPSEPQTQSQSGSPTLGLYSSQAQLLERWYFGKEDKVLGLSQLEPGILFSIHIQETHKAPECSRYGGKGKASQR